MSNKKSFMLYLDTLEVFYDLSPEEAKELIIAIIDYQKGKEITCSRTISLVFKSFQSQFVRDNEKYEAILKRNRENGSNGGRPPKASEQETKNNPNNPVGFLETQVNPNNPSEPKKPDSDSDSVSDNEKESSIENNIKEVVSFLNKKTGSSFKPETKKTHGLIRARLRQYSLEDCIKVIDFMVAKWGNDVKMKDYLTPSTLFAEANFEKYLVMAKGKNDNTQNKPTGINKYVNKNPAFFYKTQYLTAEEYERFENKNYLELNEKDVTPPLDYVKPNGI